MHNVTTDQIEKNKQLIAIVKEYPQIYNHNPTLQHSGETLEEIWAKIGAEMEEPPAVCKKKWRLLRSSMLRYLKVFKDKATSKGNRYRPYYLLEHMDFLMPFIDDKPIIRRTTKPTVTPTKSESSGSTSGTTVTIVKKDRAEEPQQQQTILYSTAPNTITYSVVANSSKDSVQEKGEPSQAQDIQQYYNAGVKIIGEDYITTYQPGDQIIYQSTSAQAVEEQPIQHQEIQEHHEQQQQECQNESKATIIPIPNINSIFTDATSPSEASDMYFLLGLLPDFRNLNHDQKRKVKIGILKLVDDAMSS